MAHIKWPPIKGMRVLIDQSQDGVGKEGQWQAAVVRKVVNEQIVVEYEELFEDQDSVQRIQEYLDRRMFTQKQVKPWVNDASVVITSLNQLSEGWQVLYHDTQCSGWWQGIVSQVCEDYAEIYFPGFSVEDQLRTVYKGQEELIRRDYAWNSVTLRVEAIEDNSFHQPLKKKGTKSGKRLSQVCCDTQTDVVLRAGWKRMSTQYDSPTEVHLPLKKRLRVEAHGVGKQIPNQEFAFADIHNDNESGDTEISDSDFNLEDNDNEQEEEEDEEEYIDCQQFIHSPLNLIKNLNLTQRPDQAGAKEDDLQQTLTPQEQILVTNNDPDKNQGIIGNRNTNTDYDGFSQFLLQGISNTQSCPPQMFKSDLLSASEVDTRPGYSQSVYQSGRNRSCKKRSFTEVNSFDSGSKSWEKQSRKAKRIRPDKITFQKVLQISKETVLEHGDFALKEFLDRLVQENIRPPVTRENLKRTMVFLQNFCFKYMNRESVEVSTKGTYRKISSDVVERIRQFLMQHGWNLQKLLEQFQQYRKMAVVKTAIEIFYELQFQGKSIPGILDNQRKQGQSVSPPQYPVTPPGQLQPLQSKTAQERKKKHIQFREPLEEYCLLSESSDQQSLEDSDNRQLKHKDNKPPNYLYNVHGIVELPKFVSRRRHLVTDLLQKFVKFYLFWEFISRWIWMQPRYEIELDTVLFSSVKDIKSIPEILQSHFERQMLLDVTFCEHSGRVLIRCFDAHSYSSFMSSCQQLCWKFDDGRVAPVVLYEPEVHSQYQRVSFEIPEKARKYEDEINLWITSEWSKLQDWYRSVERKIDGMFQQRLEELEIIVQNSRTVHPGYIVRVIDGSLGEVCIEQAAKWPLFKRVFQGSFGCGYRRQSKQVYGQIVSAESFDYESESGVLPNGIPMFVRPARPIYGTFGKPVNLIFADKELSAKTDLLRKQIQLYYALKRQLQDYFCVRRASAVRVCEQVISQFSFFNSLEQFLQSFGHEYDTVKRNFKRQFMIQE